MLIIRPLISSNSCIFFYGVGGVGLHFHSIPSFLHPELRAASFYYFFFVFLNRKSQSWLPKSRFRIESGELGLGSELEPNCRTWGRSRALEVRSPKFGNRAAPGAPAPPPRKECIKENQKSGPSGRVWVGRR